MKKSLLIIARNFPPMGGVGTRRWSKFSKYLAEKGYRVHVLTIAYPYQDRVNWSRDVDHPDIVIHRLKSPYPVWLLKHGNRGFVSKKLYELVKLVLERKRFWLDNAQGWQKTMIPYARKLIREEGIKNVMVTAAPCSAAYYSTFLKIENPEINLLMDFRDSWNDERWYEYGTFIKDFRQKEQSATMEMASMYYADKVIFTSNFFRERNARVYKSESSKFLTITNGFDRSDYKAGEKKQASGLSLVYLGSLLGGSEKGLDLVIRCVKELDDPILNEKLSIDVYGRTPANYRNPDPAICTFKDFIAPEAVAETLSGYYAGLSILTENRPYAIATKTYDYMAMGMPVLHVSQEGDLYRILKEKGQYTATYDPERIKEALLKLRDDFRDASVSEADYSEFDLVQLASRLEDLFE